MGLNLLRVGGGRGVVSQGPDIPIYLSPTIVRHGTSQGWTGLYWGKGGHGMGVGVGRL